MSGKGKAGRFSKTAGSILFLLLAGFMAAGMAGCGREEEKEPVELTFIHGWGGTVKTHAIMQEIYEEFERRNPDIVLKFQPSSDSRIAVKKANDMLAVDKMPDIVSTNGQSYYVANAVKRGRALDLMPYIEADTDLGNEIHPSVLEAWTTQDGCIFTVPDALEVMGYWYNTEYFIKAGITEEDGNVKIPKTWEEFYEVCEKLQLWEEKQRGEDLAVYALEKVQISENLFLARLAGTGEEGLSMVQRLPDTFDTLAFRKTVEDFRRILEYSRSAESLDDARQYFKDGKTAMYFNGVWESEELEECANASNIAYANYPSESGKSLSYISPSSGYIFADGKDERKKEAAIRFLKYILSEEVQLKLALETGQAPSNPNVDSAKIIRDYPMLGNALEKAHKADIRIKTITSVWNSILAETIAADLENACDSDAGIEQLIRSMDKNKQ